MSGPVAGPGGDRPGAVSGSGADRTPGAATPLDRSSPLPLWAQLADDLRRRLSVGDFDEQFPSEHELQRHYEVSRHTVREAVQRLETDGLLDRRRGRATTVTRPSLEQPLSALYSLAETILTQGFEERSEVVALEIQPAEAQPTAARLDLAPGDPVVFIMRVRFAGDEPIAVDRSWLPADIAGDLLRADLRRGSLYEALAVQCGVRVVGGWERIRPRNPTGHDRRLLRLPATEAVFSLQRLVRSATRPVEWRESLVRGDHYCFVAEWPAGSGGPA